MRCPALSPADPEELQLVADRLRKRVQPYASMVEDALEPLFGSGSELDRAVAHVLFADAKRVRASLALIASEAAGGHVTEALPIAVAFELLHTASLVHDDIMDGATLRRGRPCVHLVFGTSLAITAGDALIFEAYRRALSLLTCHPAAVAESVLHILTSCAARACQGQALDLRFAFGTASTRQYLKMASAKTGSMLEAPLECAAVLAGVGPSWRTAFRSFGRCLGIAFQIADDATDFVGTEAKAGKTLGNDLRNGAGSAMLTYTRHARDPLQPDLRHGAMEWAQRLCAHYADRASCALERVGVEPARSELAAIAKLVGRWNTSRRQAVQGGRHEGRQAVIH